MSSTEASQIRAFWENLELPGIFDVHTHFMPNSVMDKVWAYFDSAGEQSDPGFADFHVEASFVNRGNLHAREPLASFLHSSTSCVHKTISHPSCVLCLSS